MIPLAGGLAPEVPQVLQDPEAGPGPPAQSCSAGAGMELWFGPTSALANGLEIEPARLCRLPENEEGQLAADFDGQVMIRPEHITLSERLDGSIPCTVRRIQFLGTFVRYIVHSEHAVKEVVVDTPRPIDGLSEGADAGLTLAPEDSALYFRE